MKKILVFLLICVLGTTVVSAQRMQKGMGLLNVGAGFVPGIGAGVSYDYGLIDTWGPGIFTVGGYIGFNNWGDNYYYALASTNYRTTEWFFAPRATYRYAINDVFEVYGTAMLGLNFHTYSDDYYSNAAGFDIGTTVGCRYSFSPKISAFAEAGYNVSYISLGITFAL